MNIMKSIRVIFLNKMKNILILTHSHSLLHSSVHYLTHPEKYFLLCRMERIQQHVAIVAVLYAYVLTPGSFLLLKIENNSYTT